MLKDIEIDLKLFPVALRLVKDEERCRAMSANIKLLAKPEATIAIVDEIENLLK
mgnify:FL=1